MKFSRHFLVLPTIIVALSSCGLFQAPPAPTPERISQNISRLESGTVVTTVAIVPMDIPNPTQPKIINTAVFRVSQDVRAMPSSAVVIPQNSLITGVYSNDGKICEISWQAIYHDYQSLEKNQASLNLGNMTLNTNCNPKLGIRAGDIINIKFK